MIALCGKIKGASGPASDVVQLHVIVGPETATELDVFGAQEIDITDLARMACAANGKGISLVLTRSENEHETHNRLTAAGAPHMVSFEQVNGQLAHGSSTQGNVPSPSTAKPESPKSKCSYCGSTTQLLDIPGFSICKECAIIELSILRASEVKKGTDTND